jgi:tRNA-2-methylthio-N6-dimethylallyladenosine synthase
MKYSVVTFGCRVNQADSLSIEGDLLVARRVAVPPDEADLVVVNTCSVPPRPIRVRGRRFGAWFARIPPSG